MDIIYITFLTLLASAAGTFTGFGTSTIMVPIILFFLPLPKTLLLVGVIHWFGDIWKIALFKRGVRWRLIFLFGIPGVLFTFLGASFVFSIPETLLSQILGGFLLAYVSFLFIKPTFKFKQNASTAVAGGALSGFFAGIFGVGGAVRGAFLSTFDLPKDIYIATSGAIALTIDSVRLTTYFFEGATLSPKLFWGLLFFIPASFLGAQIAKKIVDRIPQKKFRVIVAVSLSLVGIKLLIFPS